jgi:hypothetical protein
MDNVMGSGQSTPENQKPGIFGIFSSKSKANVGSNIKSVGPPAPGAPVAASGAPASVAPVPPASGAPPVAGQTIGGSRKKKMKRVKRNKTNKYKKYKK